MVCKNYLVFQLRKRYFKIIVGVGNGSYICYWKSKRLSDERINSVKTSDYGIISYLSYYHTNKVRVKFDGRCLKQDQATLLHGEIVNIYIFYEIADNFNLSSYSTLESYLNQLKTLTLTNMDILVMAMELDLIGMKFFHFLALD